MVNLCGRYEPGDVAVVHPVASQTDVDAFLEVMGWTGIADDPVKIVPHMSGEYARFCPGTQCSLIVLVQTSRYPVTFLSLRQSGQYLRDILTSMQSLDGLSSSF